MAGDAIAQLLTVGLGGVAVDAPTHVHAHNRNVNGHVRHITMAFLAVQPTGYDVRLVTEVDEARQDIDPLPWDRLTLVEIIGHL